MKKSRIEFITNGDGHPAILLNMILTKEEEDALADWTASIAKMERLRIFNELNRVTLVDDDRGGIQYERHNIMVDHSIQDNGQTLKLFIKEN